MEETRDRLQQVLNDCARHLEKLHDWTERTNAERESFAWGYREGQFDMARNIAYFTLGVSNDAGVTLDETRLDRAMQRGDFL